MVDEYYGDEDDDDYVGAAIVFFALIVPGLWKETYCYEPNSYLSRVRTAFSIQDLLLTASVIEGINSNDDFLKLISNVSNTEWFLKKQ